MPPEIEIPEALRSRRVEVVFLELDEDEAHGVVADVDWPDGLFERTAGAWQGEPLERAPQGEYERRQELE
jgi:hypothetical protein